MFNPAFSDPAIRPPFRDRPLCQALRKDLVEAVHVWLVAEMRRQQITPYHLAKAIAGRRGSEANMPGRAAAGNPRKNYSLTTLAEIAGALGYRVRVEFAPLEKTS